MSPSRRPPGTLLLAGSTRIRHWPRQRLIRRAALLSLMMLSACAQTEPVLTWAMKPQPARNAVGDVRDTTDLPISEGELRVVSNRADLISGGDALVEVVLPAGTEPSAVRMDLNGHDVTSAFAVRANGRYMGLVTDLDDGPNQLTAYVAGASTQRITITNHPKGGPVFAGPQVRPWICTTEDAGLGPALDTQCNAPATITYVYQPQGKELGQYKAYDPKNPPDDVASTTTDEGNVVPYIVRVETGTIDRSIYHLAVLADPSQPWEPWAPQKGWNGKLFVPFGGGCGTPYRQKAPVAFAGEQAVLRHEFISRGWMGTASGLNALGQNCNEVVSAEALMMQKEHIEEQYGPIRHTIGRGGSGGSIQQNNIAAAYPGLLDGVTTDSSFPDGWTALSDSIDCYLLNHYFLTVAPRFLLHKKQAAAIMGKSGISTCIMWNLLLGDVGDPQSRGGLRIGFSAARADCGLPSEQRYHPVRNPQGARCSVQDYQVAIWGQRGPRHVAPLPFDNEGVQYGLLPLQEGIITPEQFVELNSNIGSLDEEWEFVPQRATIDAITANTFYRASRLSDPYQLAKTPILDVRNNDSSGDFHQPYMSWVMRARLDAANGEHGNQIIWDHPGNTYLDDAVFAMDHWLMGIEADNSGLPREQKILRDRPKGLGDTCWVDGKQTTDATACRQAHPYFGDARIAAGGPLSSDIRKCQLKPLNPGDYKVSFTTAQWKQLQTTFPSGVCDWSKPSVGYQRSIPWMTYTNGPGGEPLGPAPHSITIE